MAKLECLECGRKFEKSTKAGDTSCPKCGSSDIELAESRALTLLTAIKEQRWHDANQLIGKILNGKVEGALAMERRAVFAECPLDGDGGSPMTEPKKVTEEDGDDDKKEDDKDDKKFPFAEGAKRKKK